MIQTFQISKETQLCLSIAARPGNFGTTVFNKAFSRLGLDFLYKAMKLEPEGDLQSVVKALRALGIRGCAVSMPFKERVVPLLDALDATAAQTGAVNTIVNEGGKLTGYNTDTLAVLEILKEKLALEGKPALVCGSGGVAKAIVLALKALKARVMVTGRNPEALASFGKQFSCETVPMSDWGKTGGYLLVNATPVGMAPNVDESIASAEALKKFEAVFDAVSQPAETKLIQTARAAGLAVVTGGELALEQARRQLSLYTGKSVSREWLSRLAGMPSGAKPKVFLIDVDGVMTTGQFFYTPEGKAMKVFGPDDHDGLSLLKEFMEICFVTGDRRGFAITEKRIAQDMKFPLELVSTTHRLDWIASRWDPQTVVYMGDGIFDHYVFDKVGYGISPANGFYVARQKADFVTRCAGGDRAVAEASLHLMETFFTPYRPEEPLKIKQGSGEWAV